MNLYKISGLLEKKN